MKKVAFATLRGIGVISTLLVAYNVFTFIEIAAGKHQEYIWWLHFPLKLFLLWVAS